MKGSLDKSLKESCERSREIFGTEVKSAYLSPEPSILERAQIN